MATPRAGQFVFEFRLPFQPSGCHHFVVRPINRLHPATPMNCFCILPVVLASLLSSCVSWSGCSVVQTESHQDVTLTSDTYGVVPQMCGVTSNATQKAILRASGPGPRYLGADIVEYQSANSSPLGGTMMIDHTRHSVNVDLTYTNGRPYWMNGSYRFTTAR